MTEDGLSTGKRKLQRSSRVEQHDSEIGVRGEMPRIKSLDQAGEGKIISVGPTNKKASSNPLRNRSRNYPNNRNNPYNKDRLIHPSINELLSPVSSCSESNLSDVNSSVACVPSAFSSCHDSSAYSDYEDYDDYLTYENIGSGIVCRIEIAEDDKVYDSKGEETFPLQRSSSFTEDRYHKESFYYNIRKRQSASMNLNDHLNSKQFLF